MNESAWGEAERLRDPGCVFFGQGRPLLVNEGLDLGLAQSDLCGKFSDASRLTGRVCVEEPSQQVTGVQSIAVVHGSPFVSTFLDT